PHDGMDVGLVEGEDMVDPVAKRARHMLCVVGEVIGRVAVRPATLVLQRLRKVPVVEADPGRYAASAQAVDDALVEVEAGARRLAATGWLHPWPRYGEP